MPNLEQARSSWLLRHPADSVYNAGEVLHYQDDPYIRVNCPFCPLSGFKPDTSHHLYLHANWFKCMRCQKKGSNRILFGRENIEPQKPWTKKEIQIQRNREVKDPFPKIHTKVSPGTTVWIKDLPVSHPTWQYLLSERFSKREILQLLNYFPIHYCTNGKPFTRNLDNTTTGRIIFSFSEGKKYIGWQARWLPKEWPPTQEEIERSKSIDRYITSPGLSKSFVLYNIENALKWDTILIVEGVKKVWKTGLFSVATLGVGNSLRPPEGLPQKAVEKFWINRLITAGKEGRRIVFLYDKGAHQNALLHAATLAEEDVHASALRLPDEGPDDLDDYYRTEILKHLIDKRIRPQPFKK